MDDHPGQSSGNKYTQIHANLADIKAEEIGQDEEEHTYSTLIIF